MPRNLLSTTILIASLLCLLTGCAETTIEEISEPAVENQAQAAPIHTENPQVTAFKLVDHDVKELYEAIGEPISSRYAPSCLGSGEDGELDYGEFGVRTYRDDDQEIVKGVFISYYHPVDQPDTNYPEFTQERLQEALEAYLAEVGPVDMSDPKIALRALYDGLWENIGDFGIDQYRKDDDLSWVEREAYNTLMTRAGNCFGHVAVFIEIARYYGYEPEIHITEDKSQEGSTWHSSPYVYILFEGDTEPTLFDNYAVSQRDQ